MKLTTFVMSFITATSFLPGWSAWGAEATPHSSGNVYVGSDSCVACHSKTHAAWKTTLHSRMYQSPDQPAAILGDFETPSTVRTFPRSQIKSTIGSRWEQMYFTEIDGEDYVLPAKWLIQLKRWEPFHRDDWNKRPMRTLCHGCHAVAADPKSGSMTEVNIGCESCHGPGGDHVKDRGRGAILKSADPDICGRCHSRGRSKDGVADFAYTYRPGENRLISLVSFDGAPEGQQGTAAWWADGAERDRHQEYQTYLESGHAKALATLRKIGKENDPTCLRCHSTGTRLSLESEKNALRFGVTCIECHVSHPKEKGRVASTCVTCHTAAETKWGKKHWPCPDSAKVLCIDCHMPLTGQTAGVFNIRSHSMKVIAPAIASPGQPNSCQNGACHKVLDISEMSARFRAAYERNPS